MEIKCVRSDLNNFIQEIKILIKKIKQTKNLLSTIIHHKLFKFILAFQKQRLIYEYNVIERSIEFL